MWRCIYLLPAHCKAPCWIDKSCSEGSERPGDWKECCLRKAYQLGLGVEAARTGRTPLRWQETYQLAHGVHGAIKNYLVSLISLIRPRVIDNSLSPTTRYARTTEAGPPCAMIWPVPIKRPAPMTHHVRTTAQLRQIPPQKQLPHLSILQWQSSANAFPSASAPAPCWPCGRRPGER